MVTEGKDEEEVPALPALGCGHLALVTRWEECSVGLEVDLGSRAEQGLVSSGGEAQRPPLPLCHDADSCH